MSDKIQIPDDMQLFAKELAKLAAKHNITKLSGRFSPPIFNKWNADIQFIWEAGRHSEDAGQITVFSEYRQNLKTTL